MTDKTIRIRSKRSGKPDGFAITVQGLSHIARKIPCQDASRLIHVKGPRGKYLLAVTADGVGSCKFAKQASRCVVDSAAAFVQRRLARGERPSRKMLRGAMAFALNSLEKLAAELQQNSLDALGTTLDICLLDERSRAYVAHNGDGGMLFLGKKGTFDVTGKMNTLCGGVYTLDWQGKQGERAWAFHVRKNVAAVVMCTDGVFDALTEHGRMLHGEWFVRNQVFRAWNTKRQLHKHAERIRRSLTERRLTRDDITFVLLGFPKDMEAAARQIRLMQ